MNGTMMSNSQMLNSLTQLLNYSSSIFNSGNDESYADEQMPSTSATDGPTPSFSLSNYLQPTDPTTEVPASSKSGERQQQSSSRRRLRRERIHPVSAYFLVTDEESKCAICVLCFNVMKASKTANLMRHMTRYHKTVAADLERQWDIIKGSKLKFRPARDETSLVGIPSANASPLNNESSENGSPFLGAEPILTNGLLNAFGGEPKDCPKAEVDCENGGAAVFAQADQVKSLLMPIVDMKAETVEGGITEGGDTQMDNMNTDMSEDYGVGTSKSCPSCLKRNTDTALLVTLLKRQDQLHKKTERLIEEHVDRGKIFEEKQEEFWKRANALLKNQEEQQLLLYTLTSKVEAIVERLAPPSSS